MDQSPFAAPHGLSQRTTSFIASQRQGIHQIPLSHLIALIIHAQTPSRITDPRARARPAPHGQDKTFASKRVRDGGRSRHPVTLRLPPAPHEGQTGGPDAFTLHDVEQHARRRRAGDAPSQTGPPMGEPTDRRIL